MLLRGDAEIVQNNHRWSHQNWQGTLRAVFSALFYCCLHVERWAWTHLDEMTEPCFQGR